MREPQSERVRTLLALAKMQKGPVPSSTSRFRGSFPAVFVEGLRLQSRWSLGQKDRNLQQGPLEVATFRSLFDPGVVWLGFKCSVEIWIGGAL